MRHLVPDLFKNGIVRESDSPFASPALLVKKKDGVRIDCVLITEN